MIARGEAVPTFQAGLPSMRGGFGFWMGRIATFLRAIGPYAAIELLLPGGSLIALALWLYRRQRRTVCTVTSVHTALGRT
jgi:hypothetical protein